MFRNWAIHKHEQERTTSGDRQFGRSGRIAQVRRRYSTKNLIEPGDEQLIVEATALF
jgi:hypothetical protein